MRCFIRGTLLLGLAFAAAAVTRCADPVAADFILQGGQVYDGAGGPPQAADVAIKDGRVLAVGRFDGAAAIVLDCRGLCVAPGFIDLHNHSDQQIVDPRTRANVNFLMQGCTTIVTGNCGAGPVNAGGYLARIEAQGTGTNVAHLVPHGAVRGEVVGTADRAATPAEIEAMRERVDQAMRDGAFGMSTGLIYVPGTYAATEELVALAEVVARHRGIYASHIRNEGLELLSAVNEALQIGRRAGLPVHISHFKSSGQEAWGLVRRAAGLIDEARANGQAVTADQYPYVASSTSLEATVIPAWARAGGDQELLRRLDDPAQAARIHEFIEEQLKKLDGGERIVVARYASRPDWVGRSLAAIARDQQRTPLAIVQEITRNGGAAVVNFSMNEEDVRFVMTLPWVATASDGRAYLPGADKPHPRSYGTFPRKLGHYALREGVISLERAIHSSSALPASILGLAGRGTILPGAWADVVVFDADALADAAGFADPHRFARGMHYVFVNGTPAVWQGTPTGALAGQALRRGAALPADQAANRRWPAVQAALRGAVDRGQIAGAVALVARDGRTQLHQAWGDADLGRPMQTGAIFRIASMSKPITSVAVMMLAEEQKLRLDDPVSRWIPEFERTQVFNAMSGAVEPPNRPVTLRDLLTHTSGICYGFNAPEPLREYFRQGGGIADGLGPIDPPLTENARRLAAIPLVHHPGAGWTYGLSTDLLGRVVEVASGQPLDRFLRERIFKPLGMTDTGFEAAGAARDRVVAIFRPDPSGAPRVVKVNSDPVTEGTVVFSASRALTQTTYRSGGAGLVSTAADYARFLQMLLNGGQLDDARLLSPRSVRQMTSNQIGTLDCAYRIHGDKFGLGLGVASTDPGARAEPGESVASAGSYSWGGIYHTFFWVDPRERLVAVVMAQLYPWGGSTLWADFQKAVYEDLRGQ